VKTASDRHIFCSLLTNFQRVPTLMTLNDLEVYKLGFMGFFTILDCNAYPVFQ